jgi:hypothetical protein
VTLLKEWLLSPEHFSNPYPTEAEKRDLVERTGLSMRQLSTWFTNARKRLWRPMIQQEEGKGKSPKVILPYRRSSLQTNATLYERSPTKPSIQNNGQDNEFLSACIVSNMHNKCVSNLGFSDVQDLQGASTLLTLQRARPSW